MGMRGQRPYLEASNLVPASNLQKERVCNMPKLQKGEYECPQCKKLTVIGRTKKVDEPLTCCGVEMVPKEKTKFTEPPEPEEAPATKKKSATKKGGKKKKKKKKKKS